MKHLQTQPTNLVTSSKRTGFTIVELLIVIVVIGILAAISIVSYNGIQERARVSSKESAVKNIEKATRMYTIQNGSFPNINIDNPDSQAILDETGLSNVDEIYLEGENAWDYRKDGISIRATSEFLQMTYWDDKEGIWLERGWSNPSLWTEWRQELGSDKYPDWE